MQILVKPTAAQQADLDRLLLDQQNPSSSRFHQWLTPEQFGDRFGLSSADASKISTWLKSEGFTLNETARGRNWFSFTGTSAQVSRSFHTSIHHFEVNGKKHFANTTPPSVPSDVADVIYGIAGLDDFVPETHIKTVPLSDYTSSINGAHYLAPEDWATIYHVDALYKQGFDGSGQSIAIVGSSNLLISDIQAFRSRYGLPANDPILYPYVTTTFIDGEANLDVEWSGAVAPRAQIYYVSASSAFTALTYAINLNVAPVISISYYTCENSASAQYYRSVAQQGNAQGITILSASGDGGAAGCYDQFSNQFATHGSVLQFPSPLPEVTGVGGTQFNEGQGTYWSDANSTNRGSALSYIPEVVWNETASGGYVAASGGGPSAVYSKPIWQSGPGVPDDNARHVPDIAASSAAHDSYYIIMSGSSYTTSGTSAASPSMAGVIAILNQYQVAKGYQKKGGLGNINPQLYRLAQVAPDAFHDIVDGNNIVPCLQGSPNCVTGSYGYTAGPGYDMATGLGSVDAYNLVTEWNIPTNAVTVTLTANPTKAAFDDKVQLTAKVVAVSKGQPVPTGTVDFSYSTGLGSATLADDGTASITVPAWQIYTSSGTVSVYAVYQGDTAFSGGSGTARVQIVAPTSGSAIIPTVSADPVWPSLDSQGLVWTETVRVAEVAGVPSILTGFTIDGQAQKLSQYFPSVQIPASSTLSSIPLIFRNLASYPVAKTFGFTGIDATGQTWSQQVTAQFVGPSTSTAGFTPSLVPLTMTQNTAADPSCQWSQQLFLDETNGYLTTISSLYQGAVSVTNQVPAIFGTTRLNGFGSISGTLCWSGVTPGMSSNVQVVLSSGYNQNLQVSFAGPPASPVQITAAPANVSMTAQSTSQTVSSTVAVSLSDKTQPWSASIFPANRTNAWLTVSPLSGTGPAQIKLQANGAGFEPGVYRATIVLQSPNAIPATVSVPVMFVVGSGTITGDTTIGGLANAASFQSVAAPGMIALITGSHLANSTNSAPANVSPLPYTIDGVSVQVNGIPAPILSIAPSLLTIQVPYEAGAGPAVLGVNNNGQIAGYQMKIQPAAPAIAADSNGFVAGNPTVAASGAASLTMTGEGDVSPSLKTGYIPSGKAGTASTYRARLPLTVTVGGQPAFVNSYGLQNGSLGTTMVNFTVPGWISPGVQPVVVTVGGVSSAPVNITVPAPAH